MKECCSSTSRQIWPSLELFCKWKYACSLEWALFVQFPGSDTSRGHQRPGGVLLRHVRSIAVDRSWSCSENNSSAQDNTCAKDTSVESGKNNSRTKNTPDQSANAATTTTSIIDKWKSPKLRLCRAQWKSCSWSREWRPFYESAFGGIETDEVRLKRSAPQINTFLRSPAVGRSAQLQPHRVARGQCTSWWLRCQHGLDWRLVRCRWSC